MNTEKIIIVVIILLTIMAPSCRITTKKSASVEITSISSEDYRYNNIYKAYYTRLVDSLTVNIVPSFMKDSNCNCKINYKADGHQRRNLWLDVFDSLPSELFFKLRNYKDSNTLKNTYINDSFLLENCKNIAYRHKSIWQLILMSEKYERIDSILNSSYYFNKSNFTFNNNIKLNGIYICNKPLNDRYKDKFYNYLKFDNKGSVFISQISSKRITGNNIKKLPGLIFKYNCSEDEVIIESVINRYSDIYARFDHYKIKGDTLSFVRFEPSKDTTIKLRQTVIWPIYVFKSQK